MQWVCFHGLFDFAYLLKLLTGDPVLPADEFQFQDMLRIYFPHFFDVKSMAAPWTHLQGGLARLCEDLGVKRVGTQHQAGSDSLVTAAAFFKLKQEMYSDGKKGLTEMHNALYGLSEEEESWDGRYNYAECFPVEYGLYPCCAQGMLKSDPNNNARMGMRGEVSGRPMRMADIGYVSAGAN